MRNPNMNRSRLGMIVAGIAMTLTHISPALADHRVTLPAGTVIPVKLDQSLDSKRSQPGDKFTATVKDNNDNAGLPYGTRVEGVVREAKSSYEGKPGVIDVDFRRIVMPGGESRTIDGQLYSLNGKDVERRDGRLVAKSNGGNDRLKWVGIGAGAGVLLGTLTKGNPLLDAVLGAGAGYLYNELQNKNKKSGDVSLKEGTEFGIRLDRAVDFNVDDRSYYRSRPNDDRFYDGRSSDNRGSDDRYYRSGERNDVSYRDRAGEDDWSYRNPANRIDDIGMVIDRREVRFNGSAKPFMRNDVVMIPLDPISKMMDFAYRYDPEERVVRVRNSNVRLAIGSRVAFVNGERRSLPVPAEVHDGVVYVPMQLLGMIGKGSASWDTSSRTVMVTTGRDRD
jgi:hypothetical protein